MSATHWPSGRPRWNNGDDVAAWSDAQFDFAIANGYVRAPQYGWGQPTNHFGAAAVKVVVTSETEPPAVSCEETLTGDNVVSGSWSSDCASENRSGRNARYYNFTLTQAAEVSITLESSVDTYLFLLDGSGRVLDEDDDDDDNLFTLASPTDSGLRRTLTAGTYTIEATTYSTGITGLFTLTVNGIGSVTPPPPAVSCESILTRDTTVSDRWSSGCTSENRSGSYARYYTFTLTEAAEVSITLESSVDTYLFLLDSSGRVLDEDDDDDDNLFTLTSSTDSGLRRTLSAGTYTIEATTYSTGVTGLFILTVNGIGARTPPAVSCEETLTSDGVVSGSWSSDCASENRSGSYARYYNFTLTEAAEVSITLESSVDTYLFLLDSTGRELGEDDDDDDNLFTLASSTDSGLRRTLPAGTYTIEATTYSTGVTGLFTLTVNGIESVTHPTADGDYDIDNDGLIEISVLEQLNAILWDLDGDGIVDSSIADPQSYLAAFPDAVTGMGCPSSGCTGYELSRDLDFDDPESYASGSINTNWTQGNGWLPINGVDSRFSAIFDGNTHTISNLYINRSANGIGLFGATIGSSVIKRVGVLDVDVTGGSYVGGLVGQNWGTITSSYSTGSVKGSGGFLAKNDYIGGLAGSNGLVTLRGSTTFLGGTIADCYSTAGVEGNNLIGGLVGHSYGRVVTSYATGAVKGGDEIGGLIGATNDIGILNNILLEFDPSKNGRIISSYATGSVEGDSNIGGLVGEINVDPGIGIVGNVDAISSIETSYATGSVQGNENIGGLIGKLAPGRFLVGTVVKIEASYWDYLTTGQSSGIGLIDDASPSGALLVEGKTTEELQSSTGYSGIYATWDDEGDVWDFGTPTQYPALKADINGDGTATWEEFGDQR